MIRHRTRWVSAKVAPPARECARTRRGCVILCYQLRFASDGRAEATAQSTYPFDLRRWRDARQCSRREWFMCRSSRRNVCALLPSLTPFIHFSPACHVFVILLAQRLHHFVGGLASGECSQHGHRERMPARSARIRAACWTDEAPECTGSASRPCARLDGHCAARAPQ